MTSPQPPFQPTPPIQPIQPGRLPQGSLPPGFVPPASAGPYGDPSLPPAQAPLPPKRGNALTSKPVIGIAALILGLIIGTSIGGSGKPAAVAAAGPAPTTTVTATYEATAESASDPTEEPSDAPTEDAAAPSDTTFKWGQKVGFTYEDVEISVKVEAPKASANTFDKDNLEAKVTVCNKGSDTIDEMSAEGLGLYAEDKGDGQYDLYGAYRTPEFPVYSYDSAKLKPGKCRTGWVAFEDGRKAVRIATEVNDETYSWSKSGS